MRPTDDVNVVARVTTRVAYHRLQQRLRALGFSPDTHAGASICRMRTLDGLVLDVMPLDVDVLGFTNRCYPLALDAASALPLELDLVTRGITAPAFLATKWEAFQHRGAADPLMSHDLEDVVTLVTGRPSIVAEVATLPEDGRAFIADATRDFLAGPWASEIVAGNLPDVRRLPGLADTVLARLHAIIEAITQLAFYTGSPGAITAVAVAWDVFAGAGRCAHRLREQGAPR